MIQINTLVAQFMTVAALALTWLAHQWETVGYGLNPWIALPVATVLMGLPHILNHYFIEVVDDENPEDLSCIQLRTPSTRS